MSLLNLFKLSYSQVRVPRKLTLLLLLAFLGSLLNPSSIESHPAQHEFGSVRPFVDNVDKYGRFVNTALQVAIPLLLCDRVGLAQLAVIAITTTFMTHATKRLVNDWTINGVRLGQRPSSVTSKHNTPSGHSSMAASAVYFLARRYGYALLLVTVPVLAFTMFSRVALTAHTLSAVLSGAFLGLLMAAMFTSKFEGRQRATKGLPVNAI